MSPRSDCHELGRRFILVDSNAEAIRVIQRRFPGRPEIFWFDPIAREESADVSQEPAPI